MLTGVIEWSLTNRALVIALFVLMALGGLYAATQIPVDAVPDLVNVQVQVVTEAGTLPPLEVERLITYPVELAMSGLPDVEELRSISRLGISLVTIVFREHTDIMRGTAAGRPRRDLAPRRRPTARHALNRTRRDSSVRAPRAAAKPDGPPQHPGVGRGSGDADGAGSDRHQQPRRLCEEL